MVTSRRLLSERELEERCRNGDPDALNLIANQFHQMFVRALRRGLRCRGADPDHAEDVGQTVWCKLLEEESRLRAFDPTRGSLLGYLIQLAKDPMRRLRRAADSQRRRMVPLEEWAEGLFAQPELDPVEVFDFLNALTSTRREFCQERLVRQDQSDLVREATTPRERQLKMQVSCKWQEYQQGD